MASKRRQRRLAKKHGNEPKAHSERKHAKKRAAQRYGLELNREQLEQLVWQIHNGKSVKLEKCTNHRSIHLVTLGEINYPVVYDHRHKTIVTFLPLEYLGIQIETEA